MPAGVTQANLVVPVSPMKITIGTILARFGAGFAGFLGVLLLTYGFIEPHRPWFLGGSILLSAAIIAARLGKESGE